MSHSAHVIVRARCISNSTAWDAGEIWTFTSFEVLETWKGSSPQTITVRLLGGQLGNLKSNVSGVPRFRSGEEVVLFLERTSRGDFSVVSWQQGTFRIHHFREAQGAGEDVVTQDTAAFATFNPRTRRFEPSGLQDLPLNVLRARVQAALAQVMEPNP